MLFDSGVFLVLVGASAASAVIAIPKQVRALRHLEISIPASAGVMITQSILLSVIAAAVGSTLAYPLGLRTPLIDSWRGQGDPLMILPRLLLPLLGLTILAILVVALVYYGIYRPRMEPDEVLFVEGLRIEMGVPARILYGGIVEEV